MSVRDVAAKLKDPAVRALKTAIAVFVAAVPSTAVVGGDIATIKAGAIAAGAAVVTFIWNYLLDYSRS